MDISFSAFSLPKTGALAVAAVSGPKLSPAAQDMDKKTGGAVAKALKAARFKGEIGEIVEILAPAGLDVSRLYVVGMGAPKALTPLLAETAGGVLAQKLGETGDKGAAAVVEPLAGSKVEADALAAHFANGFVLRAYRFDRYRTQLKETEIPALKKLTVMTPDASGASRLYGGLAAVTEGVYLARDLVSEPANVLYPAEFAKRCKALSKLGVEVEVLGEKAMEKLGMGALLGVGQGSVKESQLVIMRWNGKSGGAAKTGAKRAAPRKGGEAPLAFVGKGVCFDTGGISLKPPKGMEDMKWDMGGAATVAGLMHALAARKAKVDAVGVVGLVENMPDADAQRPGDVVTSMSGQTIEIINTDAEGRLVLADALWYTQDRFKPRFMIDLATLTGAIIVTFASEYAGLFSSDDDLSEQLSAAGQTVGEGVWRQPMGDAYDRKLKSPIADMKNSGDRPGGSIFAAQFLKRFVNNTPWAHLDIAGVAWRTEPRELHGPGGTGFGVRLLDRLVADNYEGGVDKSVRPRKKPGGPKAKVRA